MAVRAATVGRPHYARVSFFLPKDGPGGEKAMGKVLAYLEKQRTSGGARVTNVIKSKEADYSMAAASKASGGRPPFKALYQFVVDFDAEPGDPELDKAVTALHRTLVKAYTEPNLPPPPIGLTRQVLQL